MNLYNSIVQTKKFCCTLFAMLCVVVLVASSGCSPCEVEEIVRKTSQDNVVDVVLTRTNCGATVAYYFDVYIVPTGMMPKDLKNGPVFTAYRLGEGGIFLEWVKPKVLTISYVEAKIDHFENYWSSSKIQNHEYKVRIHEYQLVARRMG